jgi:hypothetical protein
MTSITEQFPHPELTAIDGKPDFASLRIIHQQINANAMTISSTRGGGGHGHLALTIRAAKYNAIPTTQPWADPVHPGAAPTHNGNPTAAQITETNRAFKADLEEFMLYKGTEAALKKLILAAISDTYTQLLKDDDYGYANVTTLEILHHLDTTYGTVTADNLDDNLKRLHAQWSPDQPIEDLWNQIKQCRKYADPHDKISEKAAVRATITNLEASGVFTDALKDWRKRTETDKTWDNLKTDFNKADKERRRTVTSANGGYANKATEEKVNKATEDKQKTAATFPASYVPIPLYYCWSHGLGSNPNHTSKTCTMNQPGHRVEATADNMLGGCCIIKRRSGE